MSKVLRDIADHLDRAKASHEINSALHSNRHEVDSSLSKQLDTHSTTISGLVESAKGVVNDIKKALDAAKASLSTGQPELFESVDKISYLGYTKLDADAGGIIAKLEASKKLLDGFKEALPADRAKLSLDHDTKRDNFSKADVQKAIDEGHAAHLRIKQNVDTAISEAKKADELTRQLNIIQAEVNASIKIILETAQPIIRRLAEAKVAQETKQCEEQEKAKAAASEKDKSKDKDSDTASAAKSESEETPAETSETAEAGTGEPGVISASRAEGADSAAVEGQAAAVVDNAAAMAQQLRSDLKIIEERLARASTIVASLQAEIAKVEAENKDQQAIASINKLRSGALKASELQLKELADERDAVNALLSGVEDKSISGERLTDAGIKAKASLSLSGTAFTEIEQLQTDVLDELERIEVAALKAKWAAKKAARSGAGAEGVSPVSASASGAGAGSQVLSFSQAGGRAASATVAPAAATPATPAATAIAASPKRA